MSTFLIERTLFRTEARRLELQINRRPRSAEEYQFLDDTLLHYSNYAGECQVRYVDEDGNEVVCVVARYHDIARIVDCSHSKAYMLIWAIDNGYYPISSEFGVFQDDIDEYYDLYLEGRLR